VGLIGPNGAGKTTVFNCLSGLVTPHAGRVAYRDRDLLATPAPQRAALGIARTFQQVGLCGPQTVADNLLVAQHTLAGGRYGLPRRTLDARGGAALELLSLESVLDDRVADLPHGRQRLVEVAAALSTGPDLLLLDEPAAGLSPEESMDLTSRLLALREQLGLTVVVIEHHLPVVSRLCDYVYVLDSGHVLTHGTPSAVQRDPQVIATYLGEPREVRRAG
jgi:branched-chain amino acid transport system ATP-binding protein